MHGFLFTVLIALVNSIDSLGAWIAFSLKGIKITGKINLWISLVILAVSAASTWIGSLLHGAIDGRICSWISMALFVGMGVWCIAEPLVKRRRQRADGHGLFDILENPEEADRNNSKDIDFKEATLLAAALSINNAGGSLSAGMIGLDPWLIGLLSAAFSFGALWVGRWVCSLFLRWKLGEAAAYICGAILILIGVWQLF